MDANALCARILLSKVARSLKFAITFEDNHVALCPLALCDIFLIEADSAEPVCSVSATVLQYRKKI